MSRKDRTCYLCGAPCSSKGCAVCLHKKKYASLSIAKARRARRERQGDKEFYIKNSGVDSGD